jgi:hypothetical protein
MFESSPRVCPETSTKLYVHEFGFRTVYVPTIEIVVVLSLDIPEWRFFEAA